MNFSNQSAEEPDVNLTPLIDVVFLLLIFFMVSTTFDKQTEISIELPEASGKPVKVEHKLLEITIDAKGRYFVNQQEVVNTRLETLKEALAAAASEDQEPRVLLSADRNTPHQAVVRAMDAARQLGYVKLTFATSSSEE